MSKVLLALTAAAVFGLSGCATERAASQPAAQATQGQPSLSADAQAALAAAQADVKAAKAKGALWTTADNALKAAEAAAAKGDSATVLKESKIASDMAHRGLAQLNYPVVTY
jgi:murein lipoprotein